MINCKEASRLISEQLEHPLSTHKRILLKMHLFLCKACAQVAKQLSSLNELLSKKAKSEEPPLTSCNSHLSDEAKQRMKDQLKKNKT